MKLFIADDETDVREGIRYLLDWNALGFIICGEGKNGPDTLKQIFELKPDVVLMDIRMPGMSGLEVVKRATEQGFKGKFIILSGYSDFGYAKEAMQYGVANYITKPIDEDELEKAVREAGERIFTDQSKEKKMNSYRDKAKEPILWDILHNKADYLYLDYHDLMLESTVFQVILYTNYNQDIFPAVWDFADILRLANKNHDSLDRLSSPQQEIILLKGDFAIHRFLDLINRHISHPQKGSPLDALFLTYGRPVYAVEQIYLSYQDASTLMERRFFCAPNQHVLSYEEIPARYETNLTQTCTKDNYASLFADYIQTGNRQMVTNLLEQLRSELFHSYGSAITQKHYLADLILQVKAILCNSYWSLEIPFPNNAEIIRTIEENNYLYEILDFFQILFDMCANAIGSPTRESVMDGILDYIHHNYRENLKLSNIAELFGYNSSYLGKIFSRMTGKNFNAYVDELRIDNAKKLLDNSEYKVYEIAQMVGYSNVDYFHKKFKKHVGASPAEYKKTTQNTGQSPDDSCMPKRQP